MTQKRDVLVMTDQRVAELRALMNKELELLIEKNNTYADSWKIRGGVGAFMMLARKWDRIEEFCKRSGYDIFQVGADNPGDILDDIEDLRNYLLLVRAEVEEIRRQTMTAKRRGIDATAEEIIKANNPGGLRGPVARTGFNEIDSGIPQGQGYVNQD